MTDNTKAKHAIIGFPKCGTMSMLEYIKNKYGEQVTRPENIYMTPRDMHKVQDWSTYKCWAITRNPLNRIMSGIRYFTELRQLSVKDVLDGKGFKPQNYENVGFKNAIYQSDYHYFAVKFQEKYGVRIGMVKFEDMIKEKTFPHINESKEKRVFTQEDKDLITDRLKSAGISY